MIFVANLIKNKFYCPSLQSYIGVNCQSLFARLEEAVIYVKNTVCNHLYNENKHLKDKSCCKGFLYSIIITDINEETGEILRGVKIGMTTDIEKRLSQYNQYHLVPLKYRSVVFVKNYKNKEVELISKLKGYECDCVSKEIFKLESLPIIDKFFYEVLNETSS